MKYEILKPLAIHEIGSREKQEDSIFPQKGAATEQSRLFILCDGMGGHQKGEVASNTVCRVLSNYILEETNPSEPFTDEQLSTAISKAYDALDELDEPDSEKKMGTTLVLLYFHAGGLTAAHLGDSRYYHIRPMSHEIIYRSRDHSLVNMRFESGELSFGEIATAKNHNVIVRAMLPHQEEREFPEVVHIKDIQPGDCFFICSDGMLENMTDDELLSVIENNELSAEQKQNWMITATAENKDNHSAQIIFVAGVMNELTDADQPDTEQEAIQRNKLFMAEQKERKGEQDESISSVESYDEPITADFATPASTQPVQKKRLPKYTSLLYVLLMLIACVLGAYFFLFNKPVEHSSGKKDPIQQKQENITHTRNKNQDPISGHNEPEKTLKGPGKDSNQTPGKIVEEGVKRSEVRKQTKNEIGEIVPNSRKPQIKTTKPGESEEKQSGDKDRTDKEVGSTTEKSTKGGISDDKRKGEEKRNSPPVNSTQHI